MYRGAAFLRASEPDNVCFAGLRALASSRGREPTAVPVVASVTTLKFLQPVCVAKAQVGVTCTYQLLGVFAMPFRAFGLDIRGKLPAYFRALVPIYSEPTQAVHQLVLCICLEAFSVSVFNAQQHLPPCLACK